MRDRMVIPWMRDCDCCRCWWRILPLWIGCDGMSLPYYCISTVATDPLVVFFHRFALCMQMAPQLREVANHALFAGPADVSEQRKGPYSHFHMCSPPWRHVYVIRILDVLGNVLDELESSLAYVRFRADSNTFLWQMAIPRDSTMGAEPYASTSAVRAISNPRSLRQMGMPLILGA